jgi:hypothetical protein
MPDVIVTAKPAMTLPRPFVFDRDLLPSVEKLRMRRVMMTFCIVRKKFSPYVENGKRFLEAYAREMA